MILNKPIIIPKIWGEEVIMANNDLYCGKILRLKAEHECSMHLHKEKDETFFLLKGIVLLTQNNTSTLLENFGDTVRVMPNTLHSFLGIVDSEIIEISSHDSSEDSYRQTTSKKVSKDIMKYICDKYSIEYY